MKKLHKRILSALLAFVMLMTNIPVVSIASDAFVITYEGEVVNQVSFYEHEKITVSADGKSDCGYQWQIQIPGMDQWVDILGQNTQTIDLSKAVIGSLMVDGSAYVRCEATGEDGETEYTDALRATVKEEPLSQAPVTSVVDNPVSAPAAPTTEPTEEPIEETEAPEESMEEPTEETEAPEESMEEPTEEAEAPEESMGEPTEETEAPAEPTEEPTEETEAPAEPTEEPTEETEVPVEPTEAPIQYGAAYAEPVEAAAEAFEIPEEPAEAPMEVEEDPTESPEEEPASESFIDRIMQGFALNVAAEGEEPEENAQADEMVTVTVQFLRKSTEEGAADVEVFAPYPAQLYAGTSYTAEVPVPDHIGYTPTCDVPFVTVDGQRVIQLNYPNVTENITVTVWYQPAEVGYAVRYYTQNVYDDLYVEYGTPGYYTGLTDSYPTEGIEIDIPGFTKLYNQPERIAADGNTEFQVYYDRNYYLYIFNPDGGYGVDPVYARYGTYLSVPEPQKAGWDFMGWDLGEASWDETAGKVVYAYDGVAEEKLDTHVQINELPVNGKRVPYNKTYKALWGKKGTTYTVAYWILGDNNQRTFLGTQQLRGQSGDMATCEYNLLVKDSNGNPTGTIALCNEDHAHSAADGCYPALSTTDLRYIDELRLDDPKEIKGDGSTVLNVYYQYREYTLKFYYAIESAGTSTQYRVIGGTSHPFGWSDTSLKEALGRYTSGGDYAGQCGTVDELPRLNSTGISRYGNNGPADASFTTITYTEEGETKSYKAYYDMVGNDKFYYISFSARYKDDISQLWPCNVFESVTRISGGTHGNWSNMEAVASGWNGQHRVKYTRDKSNPTIKGVYERLDENVLFKYDGFYNTVEEYKKATEIGYVCFWENGLDNGWSVPELYVYNLWIACSKYESQDKTYYNLYGKDGKLIGRLNANGELEGDYPDLENGTLKRVQVKNGEYQYFYLKQSSNTCDNSTIQEQSRPSLVGYYETSDSPVADYKHMAWGAIFLSQASQGSDTKGAYYAGGGGGKYYTGLKKVDSDGWESEQKELTIGTYAGKTLVYDPDLYDINNPSAEVNPDVYREAYYIDYYYYPKLHNLNFYNYNGPLVAGGHGADLYFGTELEKRGLYAENLARNTYPAGLEPEAYEFAGWYYSPTFEEGTEVDWATAKMPDADLTVYAKWVPRKYTITFFVTYTDAKGEEHLKKYTIEDVEHGKPMDTEEVLKATAEVKKYPPAENAQFAGWFYEDTTGKIQAFDPENMVVTEGMRLFAQWRTPTPVDYTVKYVYRDRQDPQNLIPFMEDGKEVVTTGKAYLATTKTFFAKVFEGGYFPEISSQSMVISANPEENVKTFIYDQVSEVEYTVNCWDDTNKVMLLEGTPQRTNKAVLDIMAPYFEGYMATVAYERLYLSADGSKNVITFNYTKNETQAHYIVHHMLQGTGDLNLYEYEYTVTDKVADFGKPVTLELQNLTGFAFNPGETKMQIFGEEGATGAYSNFAATETGVTVNNLPQKGLEIWLCYDRIVYDYQIQYLEYGSTDGELLQDSVKLKAKYGQEVKPYTDGSEDSVVPKVIRKTVTAGNTEYTIEYTLRSGEEDKVYTIRADKTQVITYYYEAEETTAIYVAVTQGSASSGGTCSPTMEKVKGGSYAGSTPTPNAGFYFAGWFRDYTCTNPVDATLGTVGEDSKLIPNRGQDGTFHALFKPITLTIHQTGMDNETDSGIYQILSGSTVVATVMITGNTSVTLEQIPVGDYTIQEISGNWTWTYNAFAEKVPFTVSANQENEVTFQQVTTVVDWLHNEIHKLFNS